MGDIEDNARNLTWWWSQLSLSEDWNSMPRKMREDLVDRLQKCLIDLEKVNITKKELTDLILLTDPPTVWDAILILDRLPKEGKSRWEILAYLRATVINMWKTQHPTVQPKRQPPPEPEKPIKEASWDTVEKWDLMNFKKRHCDQCGRLLRVDNNSGSCRSCQRQRNGKVSEH